MGLTREHYLGQMQALLPRGPAWARDSDAYLTRLLEGFAEEFARVDGRAEALPIEANPETTLELLADWERVAGLPDPCVGEVEPTIAGRRRALVTKLAASGSASIAYYTSLALSLGYEITITEFDPFRVGYSNVGEPLYDDAWQHTWRIKTADLTVTYFTVGESTVGEALASWGDAMFECRFSGIKPAHTILQFAYGDPTFELLDGDTFNLLSGDQLLLIQEG